MTQDITPLKKAEQALRESEEHYRSLVELSPDTIVITCQGRIVYVNQAALKLYGVAAPEDLLGLEAEEADTGQAAYRIMLNKSDMEKDPELMELLESNLVVRWIGVSNFKPAQIELIEKIAPITSLQPPYSILSPEIETELLPLCAKHNIGVIVYSPMKSGLLTGAMTRERIAQMPEDDFRQRTINFKEPLLTRNLKLVELMRAIGNRHGRTPAEVALAWTLRRPEVTGAIVGLRSAKQVDGIIGAMDFRLTSGEVEEIAKFLRENTPAG